MSLITLLRAAWAAAFIADYHFVPSARDRGQAATGRPMFHLRRRIGGHAAAAVERLHVPRLIRAQSRTTQRAASGCDYSSPTAALGGRTARVPASATRTTTHLPTCGSGVPGSVGARGGGPRYFASTTERAAIGRRLALWDEEAARQRVSVDPTPITVTVNGTLVDVQAGWRPSELLKGASVRRMHLVRVSFRARPLRRSRVQPRSDRQACICRWDPCTPTVGPWPRAGRLP